VEPGAIPETYSLGQNYPNPFNPTTTISFGIPGDAILTIKLYNILGKEIAVWAENQTYQGGWYEYTFNADALASGVYYYRMQAQSLSSGTKYSNIKKMMVIR